MSIPRIAKKKVNHEAHEEHEGEEDAEIEIFFDYYNDNDMYSFFN